jgi:hypothetical protein
MNFGTNRDVLGNLKDNHGGANYSELTKNYSKNIEKAEMLLQKSKEIRQHRKENSMHKDLSGMKEREKENNCYYRPQHQKSISSIIGGNYDRDKFLKNFSNNSNVAQNHFLMNQKPANLSKTANQNYQHSGSNQNLYSKSLLQGRPKAQNANTSANYRQANNSGIIPGGANSNSNNCPVSNGASGQQNFSNYSNRNYRRLNNI